MAKCVLQPENIILLLSADITPFGFGYPEPDVKKSVKSLAYADPPESKIVENISKFSKSGDFTPIKGSGSTAEKVVRDNTPDSTFSSNAKKDDSSNCSQDDTLNTITSPWTEECLSWTCDRFSDKFSSSYLAYEANTVTISRRTSTATILPKSSTSYGVSICERNTSSNTTCTVFNFQAAQGPSGSYHVRISGRETVDSDTVSSWTSTLLDRSDVRVYGVLKVKYPWSPSSCPSTNRLSSDSDLYPSSSATEGVMSGVSTESTLPISPYTSKANKTTMTSSYSRVGRLTPMEYLAMSTEQLDGDPKVQLGSQIIKGISVKKKS